MAEKHIQDDRQGVSFGLEYFNIPDFSSTNARKDPPEERTIEARRLKNYDGKDKSTIVASSTVDTVDAPNIASKNKAKSQSAARKAVLSQYEAAANKLKELHKQIAQQQKVIMSKIGSDARSIHVDNVSYSATTALLKEHFVECGSIDRVTILRDRYYGMPLGSAKIEFTDSQSLDAALAMDGSLFLGAQISVRRKSGHKPKLHRSNDCDEVGPTSGNSGKENYVHGNTTSEHRARSGAPRYHPYDKLSIDRRRHIKR